MIPKIVISIIYRFRIFINKMHLFFYGMEFKKIGQNNYFWFPVKMHGKSDISIGNNCCINSFVHIWGGGGVVIGNNVMIASHVSITSLTHDYNSASMRFSPIIKKPVIINDDVWIGSGAIILPGISIGKGAVIGAGTVVTKDIPENAVVVGNPSRILKIRKLSF